VNDRLEKIMSKAFQEVVGMAERHQTSNRIASYMLAIDRVAEVHRLRGLYA
jgi:glutamate dehydrogenase (NAD(P)+)